MSTRKSTTTTRSQAQAPATANAAAETAPETVLRGRLCADPQLRHTATSGKPVVNLRIAVNDGEDATFHSVVVWGRTAEVVAQYLKKGRLVDIAGRAAVRTWTDRDGNERQSDEINAYRVTFLAGRAAAQPEVEAERGVA